MTDITHTWRNADVIGRIVSGLATILPDCDVTVIRPPEASEQPEAWIIRVTDPDSLAPPAVFNTQVRHILPPVWCDDNASAIVFDAILRVLHHVCGNDVQELAHTLATRV